MKFLIIGASGFIGGHIVRYMKDRGLESLGTQSRQQSSDLLTFNLLEHRIKDCVGVDFFQSNEPVFVVICSALSQIDRCFREKELSHKINVEQTIRFIDDIRNLNAIPVFISTSAVYRGDVGYYNEESPHDPVCEYGRHKEAVEQYLTKNAPEAFILRLDKIVSDDVPGNHLFAQWDQLIENNKPILCMEQLCSSTYVKDIAKSIYLGCQLGLRGAYNVANPEYFTRVELARQFVMARGKQTEIILKPYDFFNFADARLPKSYLDSTKFVQATGIRFTSMREVYSSYLAKKYMQPAC